MAKYIVKAHYTVKIHSREINKEKMIFAGGDSEFKFAVCQLLIQGTGNRQYFQISFLQP